jgi:flagellar biosynthesis/type III secretory pathway chaperone
LLFCAAVRSEERPAHGYPELERLAGRLIELRKAAAAERQAWGGQKAALARELDVLGRERAALTNEFAVFQDSATSFSLERTEMLRQKAEMEQTLKSVEPRLDSAESQAIRLIPSLPPMLRDSMKPVLEELTGRVSAAGARTSSGRLRNLLTFHSQIGAFQSSIHAGGEMIEFEGSRRQCDVFYLGMARGFCVSGDGSWAAVGEPDTDGWKWQPRPDIADAIRAAINVHRRERPASMVSLPLRVMPDKSESATGISEERPPEGGNR